MMRFSNSASNTPAKCDIASFLLMSCTSATGKVVKQQLFHYTYNSRRYWLFPALIFHIWFGFASHLHFCLIVVVFWLINNATTNPPVVKFICKKSRTRPSSLQQAIAISFLQLVTGRPRRQGSPAPGLLLHLSLPHCTSLSCLVLWLQLIDKQFKSM